MISYKITGYQIALVMKAYSQDKKELADKLGRMSVKRLKKKYETMNFNKSELKIIEQNYENN